MRLHALWCGMCYGIAAVLFPTATLTAADATYRSHPPMRPLASPSDRPLPEGPVRFVAPNGDDQHDGSKSKPWKTVALAVQRMQPGDVLCLRGGTYYESVSVTARGTAERPITIRGYPGELAVVDGGLREFFENPAAAWEPCPDGVEGEFRSTRTYPDFSGGEGQTNVLGRFGDSMIPLHGYRFITDLRSSNEFFSKLAAAKTEQGTGIYCGPGVLFDPQTGRIHVRLAHTRQTGLGESNYRGETDPRKLPLAISGSAGRSPLVLSGARYLRVQDLVVRGGRDATVAVENGCNIEFDGLTVYGGATAFRVTDTLGLRLTNSACRGIAAPWTFRGSLKYRAIEARLFSGGGWSPTGADSRTFELAWCEFTDSVDGVFIGNVQGVKFHHNLLDNVSDDGIFLTAGTAYDGTTPGGDVQIYQNLLSRCLTTFAFGVGHGRQKSIPGGKQTGSGVHVFRNVFDFRQPVGYQQPGEDDSELTSFGRVAGDHGSPTWEPMTLYHNTIIPQDPPFRDIYAAGLGGHLSPGGKRRVFNNIVAQVEGLPGRQLPSVDPPVEMPIAAQQKKKGPLDPLDDLLDSNAPPAKRRPGKGDAEKKIDSVLDDRPDPGQETAAPRRPVPLPIDFQADGNLHWGFGAWNARADNAGAGSRTARLEPAEFLKAFRQSPQFAASKRSYTPGWAANDVVADPQFAAFCGKGSGPTDLSLKPASPAVNAGVAIPADWPDPVRKEDAGKPDIGVLPSGAQPWRVGVRGRLTMFGGPATDAANGSVPQEASNEFLIPAAAVSDTPDRKPAALIEGYPAFDSPLLQFALRRQQVPLEIRKQTWLETGAYDKYSLVAIVGDLARGKVEPRRYNSEDLPRVKQFLERGGTLLLLRGTTDVFAAPEGRTFLSDLTGTLPRGSATAQAIVQPEHAWLRHLDRGNPQAWMTSKSVIPLRAGQGERLLVTSDGSAILYRLRVGQGQLISIGWEIANSLPAGRASVLLEQEQAFAEQMEILLKLVADVPFEPAAAAAGR